MKYFRQLIVFAGLSFYLYGHSLNAQERGQVLLVQAPTLADFIKRHKGPILDVRMAGDCDDRQSLRKTTERIAFDFGPDDPDGRELARQMFLSKASASKRLSVAKRRKETILVVCCAGGRSEAAANILASSGFAVAHVPGGLQGEEIPSNLLTSQP